MTRKTKPRKAQVVGYIRVSTSKQDADNQRYEILKLADRKKVTISEWVEEIASGSKKASERELGKLLDRLQRGDIVMVSEISRIGRSLLDVMTTLHRMMENEQALITAKEDFELSDNVSSKVLAFAFGLAAEIERQLISQRTKEALARKRSLGIRLGRPKGSLSRSKLDGKEDQIREFLAKKISKASIAKLLSVSDGTLASFIKTRRLLGSDGNPAQKGRPKE